MPARSSWKTWLEALHTVLQNEAPWHCATCRPLAGLSSATGHNPPMETHPMKAIQYQAYGSYEENRLVEVDCPKPKDDEVLVKMSTVGINPLDNTFRSGHIYLATP